jgi:hypothetical protein
VRRSVESSEARSAVRRYFGRPPWTALAQAEERIAVIDAAFLERKGIRWVLSLRGEPRMIGSCGFWRMVPEHLRAEIGYELDPEHWGRGYMPEALREILAHPAGDRVDPERTNDLRCDHDEGSGSPAPSVRREPTNRPEMLRGRRRSGIACNAPEHRHRSRCERQYRCTNKIEFPITSPTQEDGHTQGGPDEHRQSSADEGMSSMPTGGCWHVGRHEDCGARGASEVAREFLTDARLPAFPHWI